MNWEENKKIKVLVTCALPYVNNIPHIGNIVGSHLPGDIFARICRLADYDVVFIGGSDEHGTPIEIAAQKLGITEKELSDFYYKLHSEIYAWLNISYDNFSRTSRKIHHELTQDFFLRIYENGYIKEREIEMPYCEHCKRFLPDRYVIGICPKCGYEQAKGDQCEKCSAIYDATELIDMRCAICNGKPVIKKTKHLFLDLPKLQKKLEDWISGKEKEKLWSEQVIAMAKGILSSGLKERSITRDLKWGVKVPLKGYENKVFYVWFDAPIGYVSSTKEKLGERFREYWQNKDARIVHFIGKDNIPFHTIFWPAILMARGEYTLPYIVAGLQYLNYEGRKISKSLGYGVFCENLKKSEIKSDIWRFYLTFLIPESADTEWKWKEFKERINNELVANLGNFIYRTLSFIHNNFNGVIPEIDEEDFGDEEKEIFRKVEETAKQIEKLAWEIKLREALRKVLELSDAGNKYFQKNEPWKLIKGSEIERKKCKVVLHTCANLCYDLAILMHAFLPESSVEVCDMLNTSFGKFKDVGKRKIKGGAKIKKAGIIFEKITDEKLEEVKKITTRATPFEELIVMGKGKTMKAEKEAEEREEERITYDYFSKIKLRVARVIKAEKIKGSKKLFKLEIDLGKEKRQIVAGIADVYSQEELVGKQIIVVANLQKARIMGYESDGMLLAAVDEHGKPVLIIPEKEVKEGSEVR